MKNLYFALVLLFVACNNAPEEMQTISEPIVAHQYPQQAVIEVEYNGKVVYGVAITDSSGAAVNRAYAVSLELGDRIWKDTLILEIGAQQKLQGEVVFTEAVIDDMLTASVEVRPFEIK